MRGIPRALLALAMLGAWLAGCAGGGPAAPTPVPPTPLAAADRSPASPSPAGTAVDRVAALPTLRPSPVAIPTEDPDMSRSILDLAAPPADARIPYGRDPSQFGDLRLPAGRAPYPVVVVIHGGFWRSAYDLEHIGHLCAALTRAGVATWSLEYRRLGNPGGGWPGTFQDAAQGVDFLRTLAPRYGLDLTRVVITGHSAGGHLAAWAAARRRIPAADPLYSADPLPLRGVVPLAGVVDLQRGWQLQLSNGVVGELLGGSPATVPARYAAGDPAALLPLGVPQRLVHGTTDPIVPFAISQTYQAAAAAKGDDAQLVALPGAGHFELIDPRTPQWPTVQATILRLLGPPPGR